MARGDEPDIVPAPEADRLEQQELANPVTADDQPWPDSWPDMPLDLPAAGGDLDVADRADEADRLEQTQDVVGDPDEDYARDQE